MIYLACFFTLVAGWVLLSRIVNAEEAEFRRTHPPREWDDF